MTRSFVIDALPESAARYREGHAIVAVDVFRATTVIVTALAGGHPVYPVATVAQAELVARGLAAPLLAGEQAGITPAGFQLTNSPAAIEEVDGGAPVVLLSSAGTLLLTRCRGARRVYVACLRNLAATARELIEREARIALIGAGTRGEPRPEDQLVCAWIGDRLRAGGYQAENERTVAEVERWCGASLQELRRSPSVVWLEQAGHGRDVEFVFEHVDDIDAVAVYDGRQVALSGRSPLIPPTLPSPSRGEGAGRPPA